jgi:hypothetical protein
MGRWEEAVVTSPIVLVSTWSDGLLVLAGEMLDKELRNQSVRSLVPDGRGGALAIVNGRSLHRRTPDGIWSTIAITELDLACCVAVGDVIYVGTDDARVLRVSANGALEQLRGFDAVAGARHGMRVRHGPPNITACMPRIAPRSPLRATTSLCPHR